MYLVIRPFSTDILRFMILSLFFCLYIFSQTLNKIKYYRRQRSIHNISSSDPFIENTTYKKFNFHPKYNHKFQKVLKIFNITLAVSNKFNIKNLIQANTKDKDPPNKKSEIYKVNCKDCHKCYIGQTTRNIETRMKEQCRNIKCFQIDKSAVAAHS